METTLKTKRLTNAQAMLLQLFNYDLPEENLNEIRKMLAKYLFEKAEKEAEKSMYKKGMTLDMLNQEIEELNQGNRTENLKKLRAENQ